MPDMSKRKPSHCSSQSAWANKIIVSSNFIVSGKSCLINVYKSFQGQDYILAEILIVCIYQIVAPAYDDRFWYICGCGGEYQQ